MLESIGIVTMVVINSIISCTIALLAWNTGFGPEGGMRFRTRKRGYVFSVLMGALWPISLSFLWMSKKKETDADPDKTAEG